MNKRQKRGCLLVVLGLCMALSAMCIHIAQDRQDRQAGENAQILLQHLELSRAERPEASRQEETSSAWDMPEKMYMGYAMIGTIRVPGVGIALPVLSDWSEELLNIAPCRYSGSLRGENMILMGHNYKSHFTPLHNVTEGTGVEFEDVNGISYFYRVEKIEIIHGDAVEKLASEYPLTLFTCTAGGQNRVVIRCAKTEKA